MVVVPPNLAVKVAPFGRWTRRTRRAPYLNRWALLKIVYLRRGLWFEKLVFFSLSEYAALLLALLLKVNQ